MLVRKKPSYFFFFFFNDTATTEIYPLSLHDALPIFPWGPIYTIQAVYNNSRGGKDVTQAVVNSLRAQAVAPVAAAAIPPDRKSTRLNSSHGYISYAVFCLKKKKQVYHNVTISHTTVI